MEALYSIPVIGFILQFAAYLIEAIVTTDLARITLVLATPIALGALCGLMNERSGIVNIGIEGMMLTSAFVGFMAALIVHEAGLSTATAGLFGATPALPVGWMSRLM